MRLRRPRAEDKQPSRSTIWRRGNPELAGLKRAPPSPNTWVRFTSAGGVQERTANCTRVSGSATDGE